ncbi:tetratricopeptide repeat protein [Roseibium sp. M-1]
MSVPRSVKPEHHARSRKRALIGSCAILAACSVLVLLPSASPALAQAAPATIAAKPNAGSTPVMQVNKLEITEDYIATLSPEDRIELADRLLRGLPYSPTNPLRVSDVATGTRLFEEAIAAATGEERALLEFQYGKALLATSEPDKGPRATEQLENALLAGRKDAGLRLAMEFVSNPENVKGFVGPDRARELFQPFLSGGDPETLLAYANLIATVSPEEARSLRLLALTQLAVEASNDARAAILVGNAYLDGTIGEENLQKAIEHYAQALTAGSADGGYQIYSALRNQLDDRNIAGQVKNALVASVTLGSTKATLRLLDDYSEKDRLGVTRAEAEQLAGLLAETGHSEGLYHQIRIFEKLLRDGQKFSTSEMDATVAKLLASGTNLSVEDAEKLGGRILRSTLPQDMRFGYSLHFFEYALELGSVTAAYELGDLVLGRLSSSQYFARTGNTDLQKKALSALQYAAQRDNQLAMVRLGDVYRTNEFVELSLEKAEEWYTKAVELDPTPRALERLASFINATREDAQSLDEALSLLQSAAAQDSASAMTTLGTIYLRGRRTLTPDVPRALTWLSRAVDAGSTQALIVLGEYYRDSEKEFVKARDSFEAAVKAGNGKAWIGIASLYELAGEPEKMMAALKSGSDTENPEAMVAYAFALLQRSPTDREAFLLLQRAQLLGIDSSGTNLRIAETYIATGEAANIGIGLDILNVLVDRGYGPAVSRAVRIYLSSEAGTPNVEQALSIASVGLAQGYTAPMIQVALAISEGAPGIEAAPQKAILLLKQIYQKSPQTLDVAVRLGQAYTEGAYVERDLDLALQYFEEAATQGSVRAQLRTAKAYLDGIGTERNSTKAIAWYQQAADAGSTTALLQLGRIFASGGITEINPELAFVYFYRAAEADSTEAKAEVGRSLLAGFGIDQNVNLGVKWLEDAGEDGSARAMYDLFFHFIYQDSPDARQVAINWLHRAAEHGSAEAMFRYAAHLRAEARDDNAEGVKEWLTRASAAGHQYSAAILNSGWKEYVE